MKPPLLKTSIPIPDLYLCLTIQIFAHRHTKLFNSEIKNPVVRKVVFQNLDPYERGCFD